MIFVSYAYIGKHDNQIIEGFGSEMMSQASHPKDQEYLDLITESLQASTKMRLGFDQVIITILSISEAK